jgi:hypothetical protein
VIILPNVIWPATSFWSAFQGNFDHFHCRMVVISVLEELKCQVQ